MDYIKYTTIGCKDIGVKNSEFVIKNRILGLKTELEERKWREKLMKRIKNWDGKSSIKIRKI